MNIVIGICSGQFSTYAERRQWCRDTWLAKPVDGISTFFCVGGSEGEPYIKGDTLHLPCRDDASACSDKTVSMIRWAQEHYDFDRFVRCCDDSYIALDRLADTQLPGDYGGHKLVGKTYASGGAGYWLSRQAAAIIAAELPSGIYAEDKAVGELLASHGIACWHDPRFRSCIWDDGVGPRPDNNLITTHMLRLWADMDRIHREYTCG